MTEDENVLAKDNYWDKFYKSNSNFNYEPSTFYNFVTEYLVDYPEHKTIIDLGCGNGRDLINFTNKNYICTGIDSSIETCKILKTNHDSINVICDSFVNHQYKNYDIYYSRFTLHAIPYDEVLNFIDNISKQMNENSLLFVETRSIKGTEYENLNYQEANFKSGIGDYHNRTLFNKDYLIKLFNEKDLFTEYENEDNGLSPYKGEDPYLIRLVLRKVNVEKYLGNMISYSVISRQIYLKKYFDEIVNIFEENNINYVVFFGNLIGLLRHNNLFIPWDDDVDILIDKNDISKITNIFENKGYTINYLNEELLYLRKNDMSIDLFFNHDVNNVVNLSEYHYINNYRVPNDYDEAFKLFYKNFSYEKIMEECVIYNHKLNDRWTAKHMIKVKKNINDVKQILNSIRLKKENEINNIINDLSKIDFKRKIKNTCIYIVLYYGENIYNDFINYLKSMIKFNLFDTYIYIPEDLYMILATNYSNNYKNILSESNIFLYCYSDKIDAFTKNIFDIYLELDKYNTNNYDKIIFYQDFPVFINKYNNMNTYIDTSFYVEKDNMWHSEEIKKDEPLFSLLNINDIYGNNSNGTLLEYKHFKNLFNKLSNFCVYSKGVYPYLEVVLPTFIKNICKEINICVVNQNIWDKDIDIDNNLLSCVKKF